MERIYLERDRRRKALRSLRNRYLAIIYGGCVRKEPVRKIHKALFDATVNMKEAKYLLAMAIKLANRAKKAVPTGDETSAAAVFSLIWDLGTEEKTEKLINQTTQREAEREKDTIIRDFVDSNRQDGRWFYLASSHNDCAVDHKPYQGRMYVDERAPESAMAYARSRNMMTVQWVMGPPAWFITRPNCRHYFVALTEREVRDKSVRRLQRKHHTHRREGDREFQTPARMAVEKYRRRIRTLRAMYREHPDPKIRDMILKSEMLLRKWVTESEKAI